MIEKLEARLRLEELQLEEEELAERRREVGKRREQADAEFREAEAKRNAIANEAHLIRDRSITLREAKRRARNRLLALDQEYAERVRKEQEEREARVHAQFNSEEYREAQWRRHAEAGGAVVYETEEELRKLREAAARAGSHLVVPQTPPHG